MKPQAFSLLSWSITICSPELSWGLFLLVLSVMSYLYYPWFMPPLCVCARHFKMSPISVYNTFRTWRLAQHFPDMYWTLLMDQFRKTKVFWQIGSKGTCLAPLRPYVALNIHENRQFGIINRLVLQNIYTSQTYKGNCMLVGEGLDWNSTFLCLIWSLSLLKLWILIIKISFCFSFYFLINHILIIRDIDVIIYTHIHKHMFCQVVVSP